MNHTCWTRLDKTVQAISTAAGGQLTARLVMSAACWMYYVDMDQDFLDLDSLFCYIY